MRTRARGAVAVLGAAAAVCTATGLAAAVPAAPSRPPLAVSVDGEQFTNHPTRALQADGLAPGRSASTLVGLRSGLDDTATVSVRLLGTGHTALQRAVRVSVATSDASGTVDRVVWHGAATRLALPTRLGVDVTARGDLWLRITATVPASAGNEVADQSFDFGLRIALGGFGVDAVATGRDPHPSGSGVDAVGTDGPLSFTGVPVALFVAAGGLALAAGGVALAAGRRRRSSVVTNRTGLASPLP